METAQISQIYKAFGMKFTIPKRTKECSKHLHLKSAYGITLDEFNKMAVLQENKCAICNQIDPDLVVDHNHITKKIRGLLCSSCNIGLGCFKDDVISLLNAVNYLIKQDSLDCHNYFTKNSLDKI
jgi:hypothetical protein